jgi:hypothetical protein
VVQVTIGGRGELQRPEADIIKRFVINAEGFVRILHKLVYGEGGVIGLEMGVERH